MDINLTLFGEIITFALLVWVTMKYIWPPLLKAMDERQKKIADGLEAAEKSKRNLELTEKNITKQLREAKIEASVIIDQANQRMAAIIEEAKKNASEEGKKMLAVARSGIATEVENAKQQLQKELAGMVMTTTAKILQQQINPEINQKLVDQFITEL
jgi:F-type H+-transporting ATPase subunit b